MKFKILFSTIFITLTLIIFSSGNITLAATPTSGSKVEQQVNSQMKTAGESVDSTAETDTHSKDPGIVGMFGLNWKLFIAQLINFAIVLFVLWKWVFNPITKGLQTRTKTIEESLQKAEAINQDKAQFDVWREEQIKQARTEAAAIVTKSKTDALAAGNQIIQQAKEETEKLKEAAHLEMQRSKQEVMAEIKAQAAILVVAATESIIKQKLDGKKDAELINQALKSAEGKL